MSPEIESDGGGVARPPWEQLAELLNQGSPQLVIGFLDRLTWGERARAISRLSSEDQEQLLTTLEPADAADIVESLPEEQAADMLERLDPEEAALIVEELPSDEQADILGNIADSGAEAILAEMDPAEAHEARSLREYDSSEAGGLMVTEFLAFRESDTVSQVLKDLRDHRERYADYDVQYLYVIDAARRPVGVLRVRDLLLADATRSIAEFMQRDIFTVSDGATIEELRNAFVSKGYYGMPVVDELGRLLGVVQRSAVEEARAEQTESTYLMSQGIVGGEELRTSPTFERARRRLAWLIISIGLNVVTASVIAMHEDVLAAVIALAVFLPMISDMGGSAGNQAVAVSIRELTLGLLRPNEVARVLGKEITLGIVNGIFLGLVLAMIAWGWKGNPYLGLVVGGALCVNTVVAVGVGGTIPLLLRLAGKDPALASSLLVTKITDMVGFFLTLTLAGVFLEYLR